MKKLLSLVFACALLYGCVTDKPRHDVPQGIDEVVADLKTKTKEVRNESI